MRKISAFGFLACISASAYGQADFLNGTFKRPAPVSGAFVLVQATERYGDWRVVGQAGSVAWVSGAYTHDGISFLGPGSTLAAQRAATWVNLAMPTQSATGLAHSPVPTTAGAKYLLTFSVGNIYAPGTHWGTGSTVAVYANSQLIGRFTNTQTSPSMVETWAPFAVTVVADSAYTTVSFINADGPGDLNCGIGDVHFVPMAVVP